MTLSDRMLCRTDVLYYIMQLLQWSFRGHEGCFVMTLSSTLMSLTWCLISRKSLMFRGGSRTRYLQICILADHSLQFWHPPVS